MALIDREREMAYFEIPKNGSNSMKACLEGWVNYPPKANYYRFAILRNPIDRFVSAFNQHCRAQRITAKSEKREKLIDVVEGLDRIPPDLLDPHLRRQTEYLRNKPVDRYFLLETINEAWEEFRLEHGLSELPVLNTSPDGREALEDFEDIFISQKLQKPLWSYYCLDWELWEFAKCREKHPWE